MTADDIAKTADELRAILAAIERGELEATPPQVAYLTGAADALAALGQG